MVLGWENKSWAGRGDQDACQWQDGVVLDWEKGSAARDGERTEAGVLQEATVGRSDRDARQWQDGVVLEQRRMSAEKVPSSESIAWRRPLATSTIASCTKAGGRWCKWVVSFGSCLQTESCSDERVVLACAGRLRTTPFPILCLRWMTASSA